MERKKRSKGSVWEFCYANFFPGKFEEEMRAYGQKWVTFCTHTHAAKLVVRLVKFYGTFNHSRGRRSRCQHTTILFRRLIH